MVEIPGHHRIHGLANLCLTPAFVAKLTDTDVPIRALLRYRAYELFGYWPTAEPREKPVGYDDLAWSDPLPVVADVEQALRVAMRTKKKDRVVVSARELGWMFSGFRPDATL